MFYWPLHRYPSIPNGVLNLLDVFNHLKAKKTFFLDPAINSEIQLVQPLTMKIIGCTSWNSNSLEYLTNDGNMSMLCTPSTTLARQKNMSHFQHWTILDLIPAAYSVECKAVHVKLSPSLPPILRKSKLLAEIGLPMKLSVLRRLGDGATIPN